MRRPSRVVIVLAVALVVGSALVLWRHHDRQQEWEHGGDGYDLSAEVRAVAPRRLGATLEELGEKPEIGLTAAGQMVVVHVAWSSSPGADGSYEFILLDDRVSPPAPLHGFGATGPGGGQGPGWNGSYQALSEHYPWLARTADRETEDGYTNDTDAFGFHAVADGEAVLTFYLERHAIPTTAPEDDLALAVAYVADGGEVRWAKRVPLEPLPDHSS